MMLLAEISWLGTVLIVVVAGWLVMRLARRRDDAHRGGVLRMLGITAIVAGLAVFMMRPGSHAKVEHSWPVNVSVLSDFNPSIDFRPRVEHDPLSLDNDRWIFIVLGSGLVILGVLLFGGGGTRPVALKAVTVLGVGAILYAVVTFFGHPPKSSHIEHRMVSLERHRHARPSETRLADPGRPSRAKRPTLRPARPADGERSIDGLPPRAGEIPVATELAKSEAKSQEAEAAVAPAKVVEAARPEQSQPPAAPEAATKPEGEATNSQPPTAETTKSVEPPQPANPPKAVAAKSASKELPTNDVAIEQPRPEWVDAVDGLAGNGVYVMKVDSGVFDSVPLCQRELERAIKRAADHYIDDYLGEGAAPVVNIPLSYLNEHVKKGEYAEVVHSETVGQMHQIHARLEFDNQVRAEFHRRRHNAEVVNRLWYTGGGSALLLALLATLYGYLKLDLRTGGAHKGRLQLAATLVALIVAAGVLVVRWVVPF
jgi:hypothetical protein